MTIDTKNVELTSKDQAPITLTETAIVKVKAHGQIQDVPWFAMELVDGPTLAVRLAKGPLSVDEARSIFSRLLDALAHGDGEKDLAALATASMRRAGRG